MISQKPYLIRAIYNWCLDNEYTPHLISFVDQKTQVPIQYVSEKQIILNLAPNAIKDLQITNSWIEFEATFGGELKPISIPIGNVLALFAKENGQGMQFELEQSSPQDPDNNTPNTRGLRLVK